MVKERNTDFLKQLCEAEEKWKIIKELEIMERAEGHKTRQVKDVFRNNLVAEKIASSPKKVLSSQQRDDMWNKMFDNISDLYRMGKMAEPILGSSPEWCRFYTGFSLVGTPVVLDFSRVFSKTSPGIISLRDAGYIDFNILLRKEGIDFSMGNSFNVNHYGDIFQQDIDAMISHLAENWDVIYEAAREQIDSFIRVKMADLEDRVRDLKSEISAHQKEAEMYLTEERQEEKDER